MSREHPGWRDIFQIADHYDLTILGDLAMRAALGKVIRDAYTTERGEPPPTALGEKTNPTASGSHHRSVYPPDYWPRAIAIIRKFLVAPLEQPRLL